MEDDTPLSGGCFPARDQYLKLAAWMVWARRSGMGKNPCQVDRVLYFRWRAWGGKWGLFLFDGELYRGDFSLLLLRTWQGLASSAFPGYFVPGGGEGPLS
jgi:hypothetical protein